MKNGENYRGSRRSFLKIITAATVAGVVLQSCKDAIAKLMIRLSGTNHILGHRLWASNFPKPVRQIHIPYLIVGSGISGLSAARQFQKKGIADFLVVELENHFGGNSSSGENRHSKFPLGAHYLPIPNIQDKELMTFLEEEKIILGYDAKGFPIFDERQLTFTPQERLFYKNSWQESLVPKTGNTVAESQEFELFFEKMRHFRTAKGDDGKFLFDIPVAVSSDDPITKAFDKLTMKAWLEASHFTSKLLFDYVNYCCRDDFGLGVDHVSAWAGIHYFAARKHDGTEGDKENVLTWPEGNARLALHLKKYANDKIMTNHLVFTVTRSDGKVIVKTFDDIKQETIEIVSDKVIMATPQFVNQYILPDRKALAADFHYAPWLLATLTVSDLSDNLSFPLCWDNVIYGAEGLGYIYDQHQSLQQMQSKKVITYYHSFSSADLRKSRRIIYKKSKDYWKEFVLADLKKAHPNIESVVESIDIQLLGHGMISPIPGFLFGESRIKSSRPIGNQIFFAHSDLSGISVFEEAFHQGINVVNQVLNEPTLDT